jgi:phage baseplate assembly protein W
MKKTLPKFLYGFVSASLAPINMSLPWTPSDSDGLFKMNRNPAKAERDSLILWAHTNKGERVYDPEFGLDVHRHLFDPITFVKDVLQNNARQQLSKYFSHLSVIELKFITFEEDSSLSSNSIRMILKMKINSDPSITIDIVEVFQS